MLIANVALDLQGCYLYTEQLLILMVVVEPYKANRHNTEENLSKTTSLLEYMALVNIRSCVVDLWYCGIPTMAPHLCVNIIGCGWFSNIMGCG